MEIELSSTIHLGNKSLHAISNNNVVGVVNFATSKNLTVKSTMLSYRNIHKFTWTFPDGKTLQSNWPYFDGYEIHKLIHSVWNKEELPDQWKKSIIVPVQKKGDTVGCSNYRRISLLWTSYKIVSNILLSRLSLYVDEIIEEHQCRFRRSRSTTDQIFCIRQTLKKKKWEYNETVHQLFVDFKKACDYTRYNRRIVGRVVLYVVCVVWREVGI
jgi:hypothetical protein